MRVALRIVIPLLIVVILYFAAAFLVPIVLAGLLAMLLTRVCDGLERRGVSRGLASVVSVLLLVAAIASLGLILFWQLSQLTPNIDEMKDRLAEGINQTREWITRTVGMSVEEQEKMLEEQSKEASGQANMALMRFVNSLASIVINTVLVIVYTFLFLFYRRHLKRFVLQTVPKTKKQDTHRIIHKSVAVSGNYLTGLFSMIVLLWVMYSIGFGIVGLEGALFFAIICGVLEIVPFFGNFVGSLLAVFAALAQGGDIRMVAGIVVVYLIVQFLQTYLLEPLVVGQQVNINPLFTIMGLVAGELLWGIAGMALAVPVIGIVKIICDNVPELQAIGVLIGPATNKKKKASLFQSLKRKFAQK